MSVTVRLATPGDDEPLRRLTRSTPMPGRVRLAIVHGHDPAAQTVVAERAGRIVGCGRREVRERFVNGTPRPVAYLSGLRLADPDRRVILRGYGLLRELHEQDGRPVTFTSVMADNDDAIGLFRRPRRGLPSYARIGGYVTHVMPTAKIAAWARHVYQSAVYDPSVMPFRGDRGDASYHFAVRPDLLVRRAREMVVEGYAGALRLLRPCLPPVGQPLRIGCVTVAGARRSAEAQAEAARRSWTHALFGAPVAGGRGRRLRSTLFAVRWPGDEWRLDGRPAWPEVADL